MLNALMRRSICTGSVTGQIQRRPMSNSAAPSAMRPTITSSCPAPHTTYDSMPTGGTAAGSGTGTAAADDSPCGSAAASDRTVGFWYTSCIAIGGRPPALRTLAVKCASISEFAPRSSKKWLSTETLSSPTISANASASTVSAGVAGAT